MTGGDLRFNTPAEFGDEYDVDHELLPWQYRETSLLDVGKAIEECLDQLPPTSVGFTAADMCDASDRIDTTNAAANISGCMYLLHGAYPLPDSGVPRRYANPDYVHRFADDALPRVTDPDKRRAWLERYAMLGIIPSETVAAHFGMAVDPDDHDDVVDAVETMARSLGVTRGSCAVGRDRMGRVFAITLAWTEAAVADVATAFSVSAETVRQLTGRVREKGFSVPPDPSAPGRGGFTFTPPDG